MTLFFPNFINKCFVFGLKVELNFASFSSLTNARKLVFFKCQKLFLYVFYSKIHSKNVATKALNRNSCILDADHWFTSKSR